MKIITYNPKEVDNIPAFLNKNINECEEKYIMFIFNDIYEKIIDKDDLIKKYETLLNFFNLPYAFFPYYLHFNKVLPETMSKPNPRAHLVIKENIVIDVVGQLSYGMLIVDTELLKSINFKFNEKYRKMFYIQDLVHQCFVNKLYFSETYFLDLCNSYGLFSDTFKDGYSIDVKYFTAERDEFVKDNEMKPEAINDYIINLKKTYFPSEVKVEDENKDKEAAK